MVVSIVSHGHAELIIQLKTLENISKKHKVIITDNIGEESLKVYCRTHGIFYIRNDNKKGFGANNNQNYMFAKENKLFSEFDYFLILNPDVMIDNENLDSAINYAIKNMIPISTINLIKPSGIYDANIRKYPRFIDFIKSYITSNNPTVINKALINESKYVDWASGSFLLIRDDIYDQVSGFDENYFMYCEDLDICKRIYRQTSKHVFFMNNIKAVHHAAHNNRKLFSRHFFWHLKSVIRYCFISKY